MAILGPWCSWGSGPAAPAARTNPAGAASPSPAPRALARPIAAGADATAARAQVDDRELTVQVTPARYTRGQPSVVDLTIDGPNRPAAPGAVRYRFTMVGHEMPRDEGEAEPLGAGRYRIPPAERFDMGGDWRLDLEIGGRTATYWLEASPGGAEVRFVEP